MKTGTVSQLYEALRTGGCHLVDAREASEYAAEHIEAAEHLPLSGLSDRTAGRLAGQRAGLVFAAVINTCGLAMLLTRMPWNRHTGNSCAAARKNTI